jgi:hypothetical protein
VKAEYPTICSEDAVDQLREGEVFKEIDFARND